MFKRPCDAEIANKTGKNKNRKKVGKNTKAGYAYGTFNHYHNDQADAKLNCPFADEERKIFRSLQPIITKRHCDEFSEIGKRDHQLSSKGYSYAVLLDIRKSGLIFSFISKTSYTLFPLGLLKVLAIRLLEKPCIRAPVVRILRSTV
jgi:hypothetical protein